MMWRRAVGVYGAFVSIFFALYQEGMRAAWPALRRRGVQPLHCPDSSTKIDILPLRSEGPIHTSTGPTLLFIHGYPDDHTLWRHQVEYFRGRYQCVTVTLPDFDGRCTSPDGYTFAEVTRLLRTTIQTARADGVLPAGGFTFVAHDWGAWITYMYHQKFPKDVQRVVAVDIGDPDWNLLFNFVQTMYQGWFIVAARIGGIVGQIMNHIMLVFMSAPTNAHDTVTTAMNYMYVQKWQHFTWFKNTMSQYNPQVPFMYLYGGKKPVQFHSDSWMRRVNQSHSTSTIERFDNSVHWLMLDEVARFNAVVDLFLNRSA